MAASPNSVNTNSVGVSNSYGLDCASPIKIANDFILQYYSVRCFYPESLYRFYLEDSMFSTSTNNDAESSIVGKVAIQEHFELVDYQQCHSNVLAYSAHFVTPSILVILVSGELSNKGEQARRFCDVFSLIRSSADSFYIKSHMCHYQDEVGADILSDSEHCGTANNGEAAAMHSHEELLTVDAPGAAGLQQPFSGEEEEEVVSCVASGNEAISTSPHAVGLSEQLHEVKLLDEAVITVSMEVISQQIDQPGTVTSQPAQPVEKVNRSWANVANSGNAHKSSLRAPTGDINSNEVAPIKHSSRDNHRKQRDGSAEKSVVVPSAGRADGEKVHKDRVSSGGGGNRGRANHFNGTGQRFSKVNAADKPSTENPRQLFVGNIPRDVTEEQLRGFFETFGPVAEFRIHKNARSHFPNFGFVVMASESGVNTVLSNVPLNYNGHRINVEQKHPADRRMERGSRGYNSGMGVGGGGGGRFGNRQ